MRKDGAIGKYFYELVENPDVTQDYLCKKFHPCEVTIVVTENVFLRKGCVLTKTNQRKFHTFVEDYFKQHIYQVLDTVTEINDMQIKQAIDFVYDKFDMDETIFAMETIVKAYYRERESRNTLKISA
jgi:hypothetical protein